MLYAGFSLKQFHGVLLQMVSLTIYVNQWMNVHYILMFPATVEFNEMRRLLYIPCYFYCCWKLTWRQIYDLCYLSKKKKKKSMTCVKELVCLWWFYIRVHCTCSVVFSTLLPIIYCLCLVLNSERLFFISYSFRILWLENLVQTCGINSMYLILSAMVLCKTGKIWVMCGTMHFTMNWK